MKRATLAAACAVLLQSCAMAPRAPSSESDLQATEARIDAASMMRHLRTLASDEFEGRAPPRAASSAPWITSSASCAGSA